MLRASLLASLCLLPGLASAQQQAGLYINLGAGANFAGDLTAVNQTAKLNTDPGPLGIVGFGWGFSNGFRSEIEGSLRTNNLGSIFTRHTSGDSTALINPAGSLRTYAIMANLAYDIPLHPFGFPLRPYISAGLGYGWLDPGHAGGSDPGTFPLSSGNNNTGSTLVSFGSSGAFAYQAMLGASMPLGILPGLEATVEYRFFGMARADVLVDRIGTNSSNTINGAGPSITSHSGFAFRDNAMLIGLRYRFWGY